MRAGRCFAQIWWWAALGVLLMNDHLLKGQGLLPRWLTGKLSDFSGLVVAPALLISIFGAMHWRARALCFAVVALPFSAIKLSAGAARGLESLLELAGVSWRIWSDPTDLLALAMLVPLWVWARPERGTEPAPSVLDRAGVVLGALACVATSEDYQGVDTAAYLVNSTWEPIEVRLSRHPEPIDCSALDPALGWNPKSEDFVFEKSYRLEPDHAAPLDLPSRRPDAPDSGLAFPPCAAVLLEIPELPPTVVFWANLPLREIDTVSAGGVLDQQAVYVERTVERFFIAGSEQVRTLSIENAQ